MPYFLQFKHTTLIIIKLQSKIISLTISYHWAETSTETTTRSITSSTKSTEIGHIRIETWSFGFNWSSKLVKTNEIVWWIYFIILGSKWIIKRVNWVISGSRRDNHIAWHSVLSVIRVAKNLTIRTYVLLLAERIAHLRWINHVSRRIDSLNVCNKSWLMVVLKAITIYRCIIARFWVSIWLNYRPINWRLWC